MTAEVRIFKSGDRETRHMYMEIHLRQSRVPIALLTHEILYWRKRLNQFQSPVGDYPLLDTYLTKYKVVLIEGNSNLDRILPKLQLRRIHYTII